MRWTAVAILFGFFLSVNYAEDFHKGGIFIKSFQELFKRPPVFDAQLESPAIQTKFIEQKLDNFDENEARTYQMRYLVNDEYFKPGGPMFVMVGGEWTIRPSSISSGHFVDLAKKYNAIIFYTEHRFYGESRPFSDLTTEHLQYLNVLQSLADLAHFVEYQRETNPDLANAKVIMSGCSYSASMVTWFRRLYPGLIDGGWACSGPLIAKVDFREYKEMVGTSFKTLGGDNCYNRILNGFRGLENMWADKRYAEIRSMFKLCNEFDETNDLDMWTLFASLSGTFSGIAQYQTGNEIQRECNNLMSLDKDDVFGLAKYILTKWKSTIDEYKCVDVTYKATLTEYQDTSYEYGSSRPWFFQTCNEYGWYQSSGSKNQPFGTKFPATMYLSLCEDLFGSNYRNSSIHQNVIDTNNNFGGLDPGVSKIFTVHGGLDPWSTIGLTSEKGATYVPNASHCEAERSLKSTDSTEMKFVKNRIDELIGQWLGIE